MRLRFSFTFPVLMAICAGFAPPIRAQIPGLTSSPSSAPQQPTVSPDPLKRETPRGTILGFIKAAGEERYPVAIQYFQPVAGRHRSSVEDEEELAARLQAAKSWQELLGSPSTSSRKKRQRHSP